MLLHRWDPLPSDQQELEQDVFPFGEEYASSRRSARSDLASSNRLRRVDNSTDKIFH